MLSFDATAEKHEGINRSRVQIGVVRKCFRIACGDVLVKSPTGREMGDCEVPGMPMRDAILDRLVRDVVVEVSIGPPVERSSKLFVRLRRFGSRKNNPTHNATAPPGR